MEKRYVDWDNSRKRVWWAQLREIGTAGSQLDPIMPCSVMHRQCHIRARKVVAWRGPLLSQAHQTHKGKESMHGFFILRTCAFCFLLQGILLPRNLFFFAYSSSMVSPKWCPISPIILSLLIREYPFILLISVPASPPFPEFGRAWSPYRMIGHRSRPSVPPHVAQVSLGYYASKQCRRP